MDTAKQFFEEYVRDRRGQHIDGYTLEDLGYLVRYTTHTAADDFVVFSRLQPSAVKSIIDDQLAYFRAKRKSFEWKVYGFDEPGNLESLLIEQGFASDKKEVLMVCSVNDRAPSETHSGSWELRRVETEQGVSDAVSVQKRVWNKDFEWLADHLLNRLIKQPEQISIYCAYVKGKPVGTGWTCFYSGSKFPELNGGAVLPEFRGRGIYKALYGQRLVEAANRGYQQITVDASPMSRPILEKMGFMHVCSTTPLYYKIA